MTTKVEVLKTVLNQSDKVQVATYEAIEEVKDSISDIPTFSLPYKSYIALITQTGTNAPVAEVIENTLVGTPVWTRPLAGTYMCTLTGAFPAAKTIYNTAQQNCLVSAVITPYTIVRYSDNAMELDNYGDGNLSSAIFEVRVYN
jgi:hypothetical protein